MLHIVSSGTYHTGGGAGGTSTDHLVCDFTTPVTLAVRVGQQGQGSLLQQGGGVRSYAQKQRTNGEDSIKLAILRCTTVDG